MNQPKTVLLVEDEVMFRRSVASYLKDSGYRVVEAGNGREGLEVFAIERPDVVITDLRMPEMDGLEMMARLKKLSGGNVPVLIITGTRDLTTQPASQDLGAWRYFLKPMADMGELEIAIEQAIAEGRIP